MFVVKGFKKHFTPANIVLALIMFGVFFVLRTYLLPPLFTLCIDLFPNILFEVSILKDLCAGVIGVIIRLGLKGIIEGILAEMQAATQQIPISLKSEQNNGEEISIPSGSAGPSISYEKPVGDKGKRVITDSDFESGYSSTGEAGEPSGSAGPSNYKKLVGDKDEIVITNSDYEPASAYDSDSDSSFLGYPELYAIKNLKEGPAEDIEKAPKKLLE